MKYCPYGESELEEEQSLKLDEITVAGSLDLASLSDEPRARRAMSVLAGTPMCPDRVRRTASCYSGHLRQLEAWGVLRRVPHEPRVCSRYFEVAKSNGTARTIFSGCWVSKYLDSVPGVNLAPWDLLLSRLAQRKWNIISADFRHYFHQVQIGSGLQEILGVSTGQDFYLFKVLPMGLSFSPWIAQSLSWALILKALRALGWSHNGDESNELPVEVMVVTPCMHIFVLYDNLLFLCDDWSALLKFQAAFMEVCARSGAIFKEMEVMRYATWKKQGLNHLGCHFTPYRHGLSLRHTDAHMKKWVPIISDVSYPTFRVVSRIAGILIYDAYMRNVPFCMLECQESVRSLLEIRAGGKWDSRVPEEGMRHWKVLLSAFRTVLLNQTSMWTNLLLVRKARRLVMASDAYDYGGAFLAWNELGTILELQQYPESKAEHIYYKELRAAVKAILWAAKWCTEPTVVVLMVDNTAVLAGLQNGYSSSQKGNALIRLAWEGVRTSKIRLVLVGVAGEHNPADHPSRFKPVDPAKVAAMQHWFEEEISPVLSRYRGIQSRGSWVINSSEMEDN